MMKYDNPEDGTMVPTEALSRASKVVQIKIMREWFFQHFEDPAESCPYDSSEDGYSYIWGGPYEAVEVLFEEFSASVSEDTIRELADELNLESWEWSAQPGADDYEQFYIRAVIENTEYHKNFESAMSDIELLLDLDSVTDPSVKTKLHQLLFVNVITSLETYLSDAFSQTVLSDKKHMRKLVETARAFKEQSVPLSAIFDKMDRIQDVVGSHLMRIVWHDLEKVERLFRDVLSVDFPSDTGELKEAVIMRHDFVHRNGKTKDGEKVAVSRGIILALIGNVRAVVGKTDEQLPHVNKDDNADFEDTAR